MKNCGNTLLSLLPPNLPTCDPQARYFPKEWKQSYFRRHYDSRCGGYVCPDCEQVFSGPKDFQQLDADHIKPHSRGGLTVWENLTLRCKPCNVAKSNRL
ncbi:HNH endonuclease [Candidatus Poribacteria bacterium]|nr:HNH endonuclease [Candidatus Poribacteria bacterium]